MSVRRPLHTHTPVLLTIASILVLALTLAGCGEKQETTTGKLKQDRLILLLDWAANPDHAGIFTGLERGRFADQGVGLKIQLPSDGAAVIKQVEAGRADLGISYQSEVMSARDAGANVRAIAALVQRPLNSLMWLKKSGIRSIKDLEGKRVGISGAFQAAYLDTILKENGVDPGKVDDVDVGFDLQTSLVGGKVDATLGGYWNIEAVELGLRDRPVDARPVNKLGVPTFNELVIIASDDHLKDTRRTEIYRRFLAGLARGTSDAIGDPELAVGALLKQDKALKAGIVEASLKATLPVLTQDADHPYGYMDPMIWTNYANWMRDHSLLKNPPNAQAAYTNDFLPGQGPE